MKIYESRTDWSSIMRKIIILIQIITIALLLSLFRTDAEPKKDYFIMEATAYTPGIESCGEWADGYTYTGDKAGYGCVAIDPNAGILELGQKVYVEGYGYGICNDIGGAIKGWKIDVCFSDLNKAKEWGRKLVKVYVVEDR